MSANLSAMLYDLKPEHRAALLRQAAEVLGSAVGLPMATAARYAALDAVDEALVRLRSTLVFRRLDVEWFELGEAGHTVRLPIAGTDGAVLWYCLTGRADAANGLLDLLEHRTPRAADALRHRLQRLAGSLDNRYGFARLATAVRAVVVPRDGVVYLSRRVDVAT